MYELHGTRAEPGLGLGLATRCFIDERHLMVVNVEYNLMK